MKERKIVAGGCGACARARGVLPARLANGLAALEQRKIARRAAARAVAAAVPPNAATACEHGTPRNVACTLCRGVLDTQLARSRRE